MTRLLVQSIQAAQSVNTAAFLHNAPKRGHKAIRTEGHPRGAHRLTPKGFSFMPGMKRELIIVETVTSSCWGGETLCFRSETELSSVRRTNSVEKGAKAAAAKKVKLSTGNTNKILAAVMKCWTKAQAGVSVIQC